ncbi:MAG: lipocalin family protein [Candidatus Eremiobacteraeota bacterium]|nr:lipocalin family protein [Candidatus Eremiobacteraeota bacterium]
MEISNGSQKYVSLPLNPHPMEGESPPTAAPEPRESVDIGNAPQGRLAGRPVFPQPTGLPASAPQGTEGTEAKTDGPSEVRRPVPPEPPAFPADEGAHPGVKTEWWYVNGHLKDSDGRRFGFHEALFDTPDVISGRYNIDLPGMPGATMLDTAFLELDAKAHTQKRILHLHMPGADHPGLSEGKLDNRFDSPMGEWQLRRIDPSTIELDKPLPDGKLHLTLREKKAPLMMGGQGEIPMGPKGLSKYYTHSSLKAEGTITRNGKTLDIKGSVWMDHQWGDMSMFDPWKGWDWFGIQLDGGRQLNAFNFRNEDGTSLQTTLGISNPDGTQEHLDEFTVKPGGHWESPVTGACYPLEWTIEIPAKKATLHVKAYHKKQEVPGNWPYTSKYLSAMPTYWEGACKVTGTFEDKPVKGKAYMELLGYEERKDDGEKAVAEARKLVAAAESHDPSAEMLFSGGNRQQG